MIFDENKPLFSIIITAYNSKATIQACIDSVLAQSERSYEIIVVDDASTDGTQEIIRDYTEKHSNINAIFHVENKKKPFGLNEGIKAARGMYISIIDSDDTVGRDCYAKRKQALEDTGYPDALISGYTLVESDKTTIFETPFPTGKRMTLNELLSSCGDIHTGNHLCFSCRMLFKRELLIKNEIFVNESIFIGEDLDFNLRAMRHADSIAACDENDYRYIIINPDSLMRSKYKAELEESLDLQYKTRISMGMDIRTYRDDLVRYYVETLTFNVINNQINSPEGLTPAALRRILDRRCFRETWRMTGMKLYHAGAKDLILRLLLKFRLTGVYCGIVKK